MYVWRPPLKLKVNQKLAIQNPQKKSGRTKKTNKGYFCRTPCSSIRLSVLCKYRDSQNILWNHYLILNARMVQSVESVWTVLKLHILPFSIWWGRDNPLSFCLVWKKTYLNGFCICLSPFSRNYRIIQAFSWKKSRHPFLFVFVLIWHFNSISSHFNSISLSAQ